VHEYWTVLTNRDASVSEAYNITTDPYEKTELAKKKPENESTHDASHC
jgi:hypothetical protein